MNITKMRQNLKLRAHLLTIRDFAIALVEKFQADRTTTLAASLAFYTILSLAPLSVVILYGFSKLDEQLLDRFIREAISVVGYNGGSAIELMIRSAQGKPLSGGLASLISLAVVLFSASAMFGELRETLAIVLRTGVDEKNEKKQKRFFQTTWQIARDRLLSIGFAIIFVITLATFLVISALIAAGAEVFGLLHLELPISFLLYSTIFTIFLMYGTPRGLSFKPAWKGGAFTSFLFMGGKTLIGYYISNSTSAGSYGAAGSIVALLLWIFCASLILLTGAQAGWLFAERGRQQWQKEKESLSRAS